MNRKIVGILICLLLCTSVSAVAGIENNEVDICLEEKIKINSQPALAQWDLQFAYDVDTPTNEQSLVGCEFDGEHFLVSEWGYSGANQSLVVSKLDRNGSLVSQWFPTWLTGTTGLRDLAYDGEYFYGSNYIPSSLIINLFFLWTQNEIAAQTKRVKDTMSVNLFLKIKSSGFSVSVSILNR